LLLISIVLLKRVSSKISDNNMPDTIITKKSTADMKSSPPSIKNKKQPSSNVSSNLHNKSESPEKPETSTKRSKRSSTRNSSASANAKKRSRTSDEQATHRSRPKRRAASSVQIGSYKDMENVDFSLLDHFSFGDTSASLAKSRKKSPRSVHVTASASKSKKKSTLAALKRSALMVSKQSMDPAESPSSETLTTNSTNIPGAVAANTLIMRKQERARKISGTALENLLPPILLRRAKDGYCTMPKFLHHLVSSNGRVEIFNRKTGKIMKGEQSVPVKNLVNELQAHSEYEPIIYPGSPRPSSPKSPIYRQARSSTTARVSGKVQPQSSLRASKVVGRTVLITGGSHKGQFGE
jgi:hypothetical protein